MSITDDVQRAIQELLPEAHVEVSDPMRDETHLEAIVVAPQFEGMPLFKQHQVVMRGLKEHFATTLHALKLNTYSPSQWKEKQS